MSLDLTFSDEQAGILDAIRKFTKERCPGETVRELAGKFPTELWAELAELGVLPIATEDGGGGALEVVAAMEALGAAVFPGPLAETFLATQILEGDELQEVGAGESIVSLSAAPRGDALSLVPWPEQAKVSLQIDGTNIYRCKTVGSPEMVTSLGGDPYGRVKLERTGEVKNAARGLALFDIAVSAYMAAAGDDLVEVTAEHARTRKQFGRTLGEFQAVAHPLAESSIALSASRTLARAAACAFDEGRDDANGLAAGARLSARKSALFTVYASHQIFGAMGITLEGPVYHVSRRSRQLSSAGASVAVAHEEALALFGINAVSA